MLDVNLVQAKSKDHSLKHKVVKSDQDLMTSLSHVVQKAEKHFVNSKIEKVANWVLYKDKWIDYESGTGKNGFYNYTRGDIVLSVDFGTSNMGTEIRYPHPCVVLYDNNEDWVIVAPITAAQIDPSTGKETIHPPFEVFVDAQTKPSSDQNEFFFKKKSVIQVDQICRISKYRSINRTKKKLRVDLLNQIDNVILKNFTPKKDELLETLKLRINEVESLNALISEKILNVEEENERLKSELALLKGK